MTYGISARDCLARATDCLSQKEKHFLFYAAFELRCGVEARMQEYLEAWDHISERKKNGWQLAKLGQDIESAFRLGDKILRWEVRDGPSNEPRAIFYYTPVTERLRQDARRLGDYLHAARKPRLNDDAGWAVLRELLLQIMSQLQIATTGTLLGPALMMPGSGEIRMNSEMPPSFGPDKFESLMQQGAKLIAKVDYLETLPDPLEQQAIFWRVN